MRVDLGAGDRGGDQHLVGRLIEAGEAAPYGPLDTVGNRGTVAAAGRLEPRRLEDEERVAAGALHERVDLGRVEVGARRRGEGGDVVALQGSEADDLAVGAQPLHGRDAFGVVGLVVAPATEHQDAGEGGVNDELEHQQALRVGVVQVVEHQQHRGCVGAQPQDLGHGGEEGEAVGLGRGVRAAARSGQRAVIRLR